jgi:hypothetical protein
LAIAEPRANSRARLSPGRLYCASKALWKLGWFLRDFLYDHELLGTGWMRKPCPGSRVVKIHHTTVNGTSCSTAA